MGKGGVYFMEWMMRKARRAWREEGGYFLWLLYFGENRRYTSMVQAGGATLTLDFFS